MKFSYTLLKKLLPSLKGKNQLVEALNFHAFEVEGVDGDTVNIALPSNRYSDAASHLGVARLLSAISGGMGTIVVQSFVVFILLPILSIGFILIIKSTSPTE